MGNIFCAPGEPFEVHPSFRPIIDKYDAFIIDQWGVMHNGVVAMEGASECVQELARQGKKCIILSNTSSSEESALSRLPKLGFDLSSLAGGAVTSGDLATAYIRENYSGKKALVFSWKHPAAPDPQEFMERCDDIVLVDNMEDDANLPDVVILHGNEVILPADKHGKPDEGQSLGDYILTGKMEQVVMPVLKRCAERSIPVLCVDPDLISVNPDGTVLYMPGTIANYYERTLRGPTLYFGKPDARAFRRAVERLQQQFGITKERMCHIGDSLHHDIAGANSIDLDSVLVLGGVHRVDLENDLGKLAPTSKLQDLFQQIGHTPTHVAPLLQL
uniref:Uncharacterized protein n=1 Tax=Craspedostauros australis TaxID=1486917 RepID=A0A7R9WW78_9STRA|mmetsp:Transcript_20424/g.56829  ORF Transcript_20424/g.56829 Transcript_20424/m.56829 type:complete len:331 (+) Transcript_20424:248-1240(+)